MPSGRDGIERARYSEVVLITLDLYTERLRMQRAHISEITGQKEKEGIKITRIAHVTY